MKDYKIYAFEVSSHYQDKVEAQVYAKDFYIAWDTVIGLFGTFGYIDFIGIEITTMPLDYDLLTNQICLSN